MTHGWSLLLIASMIAIEIQNMIPAFTLSILACMISTIKMGKWDSDYIQILHSSILSLYFRRQEQERRIIEQILHEDYNCDFENDIAVVKLDRPVEFIENRIATISLPCAKNSHNSERRKQQKGQGKKKRRRR